MQTIEQASEHISDPQHAGAKIGSGTRLFGRQGALSNPPLRWLLEAIVWLAPLVVLFAVDETGLLSRFSASLFVLTIFFVLVALLGNLRSSAVLSGVLVAIVAGISFAKTEFLGVPFVVNDVFYLTGESLRATLMQYKAITLAAMAGAAAALALVVWTLKRSRVLLSMPMRGAALVLVAIFAFKLPDATRVAFIWDPGAERASGAISSFANSLVSFVMRGSGTVSFASVGPNGLDAAAVPVASKGDAGDRPDILMVLDESIFDPRDFNLPVQEGLDEYFAPHDSVSGRLNVNVHGGGTWVSEFSATTGLETRSFGDQAYYLPVLMAGRVKHSLMTHLKDLGYETLVVYCMNASFMNARANYIALGADGFHGPDTEHVPGIVWISRDRHFYQQTLDHIERIKRESGKPVFAMVVTIYNHGPHVEEPAKPGDREEVRSWLSEAAPGDALAPYRDYYLRLQHNMGDYRWLKQDYARRFPDRSMVVAHFGDHQPKFTKDLVADAGSQSLYITRFAIEGVNRQLAPTPGWGAGNLDIAYLPALVLSASGLRLDDLFSARLDLMQRCEGLYASCRDPLKGQIHRTLVDRGLVDVDIELTQQPSKLAGNQY